MEGAVVMIIVLLIFPVIMLMSMAVLAGILGSFTKASVDAEHEGSILLEMSNFDPYDGPPDDTD
ncbi:MAG: hypothetical protein ACR2QE_21295 [Acidimicrobiales bacterium]